MNSQLVIFGSLAYDHLLKTKQKFLDVLPRDAKHFNISVINEEYAKVFGGTGGNIGYYLSILNEKPLLVTSIGEDGGEYIEYLKEKGLSVDGLYHSVEKTASAHIITDSDQNQVTSFYPGALKYAERCDFQKFGHSLVSISPSGSKEAMRLAVKYCVESNIAYIFDPGQMIGLWTKEELLADAREAKLIIMNQYEYEIFLRVTELSAEEVKKLFQFFVVTLGAEGSMLIASGIKVQAAKPENILNSTGCGDAYRAGILSVLSKTLNLSFGEDDVLLGMKVGTILASFAIECDEGQNQELTKEMIPKRYFSTFDEELNF